MGNAIGKIIEEFVELFKRNYKRPRLWFFIVAVCIFIILLIPYIDYNFFYFSRMEKRIGILERIMTLNQEVINSNQAYLNEYQSILQEMEQQSERSINSVTNKLIYYIDQFVAIGNGEGNKVIKFFTGAIWFIIITLCVPFMNTFDNKSEKVLAFVLLAILSIIIGFIFSVIPIVISPLVNYIGFPILQIVIVIIFATRSNKKKNVK